MKPGVAFWIAVALATWAVARSGDGIVDLGGGLVMRDDGTVVAAWDLPGCESADDAFDAPEVVMPRSGNSSAIWRARFDRGW
jgi:hypothetical protein